MAELSLEEFKQTVDVKLQLMSSKQQMLFAHSCALRALPYLFQNGYMEFWPKEKRSAYIYSIFNALDAYQAYLVLESQNLVDNTHVDMKMLEAAYTIVNCYPNRIAAYTIYQAFNDITDCAASLAYLVTDADPSSQIKALILEELTAISLSKSLTTSFKYPTEILKNFQHALVIEGFDYWAELYSKIYDNNCEVDPEELKQRLNVPQEIKAQGSDAVGNYMQLLTSRSANQLNEARILILGDKGAGKTCLARRLVNPNADMTTPDESTAGVDTSIWTLESTNTKVRIWDFAGHTVTHAVHRFFLSERCLYILVYDGRTEQSNRLEYWLDHMKNYGGDSQAIIVVNEKDQHKTSIPINKIKAKYAVYAVYYINVADSKQMEEFRNGVFELITNNLSWNKQHLPSNYYKVKEELERLFDKSATANDNEIINISEFNALAKSYDIDNPQQLLKDLNALGISFWYPGIANFDKLILNPEWISHGVYKIINWVANQSFSSEQRTYAVSLGDFEQIFSSEQDIERFGHQYHEFLFKLIQHFELAYESQGEKETLIFPHLLNEDQPTPSDLPVFGIEESLILEYRAKQPLPPNTISRFIVRHNQQIQQDLVWRTGVVLVDNEASDTIALASEVERTISISVKGSNKSAFIEELRNSMNDIFANYKSDKPELLYQVIPYGRMDESLTLKEPVMLTEEQLVNHVSLNRNYFEDKTVQEINLKPTVSNYNIVITNFTSGERDSQINIDNSTTFNYQDCNFELQGGLNELAIELMEANHKKQALQLENTAKALERIENCETPAELKKSGVGIRLKRLFEEMGDKNSELHKVTEDTKNGVDIAQDLAEKYNLIAQWAGLPQVPNAFIGNER